MKDRDKLIIAIATVLGIIVVVGGATFAYWTWVSSTEQQTTVAFTLTQADLQGSMYANLEGSGTTTATALRPTTCTDTANVIKKKVTINYLNKTTRSATIAATLKVTAFTLRSTSYVPETEDLQYLKYALTTSDTNCTTGVQKSGDFSDLTFTNGVATLPLTLFTQEFTAVANMTAEAPQEYYLWIWLDSKYNHPNTGDENTDPMQELSFTTQWSGTIAQNATE